MGVHKKPTHIQDLIIKKKTDTKTMSSVALKISSTLGRRLAAKVQDTIAFQVISKTPNSHLKKVEQFKPVTSELYQNKMMKDYHQTGCNSNVQREYVELAMQMGEVNRKMPFNVFK